MDHGSPSLQSLPPGTDIEQHGVMFGWCREIRPDADNAEAWSYYRRTDSGLSIAQNVLLLTLLKQEIGLTFGVDQGKKAVLGTWLF